MRVAEDKPAAAGTGARKTWLFIASLLLVYLVWVLVTWTLIGERERHWLHGVRPAIPANSPVSSDRVPPPTGAPQSGLAPAPTPTADTTPALLQQERPPLEAVP